MQLIEVTDFGIRSAAIWLQRRETPLRFVLFPMLHLGSASFHADVTRRLAACQVIVTEGVTGRSAVLTALTAVYRIPGRYRGDLMAQDLDLGSSGAAVIRPDVDAAGFNAGWRRVPIALRLTVLVLAPLVGIWLTLVGPTAAFSRVLTMDDLPTREETDLLFGAAEKFEDVVGRSRDALLLRCLDEIHQSRSNEAIDVGIVYGAQHMRSVVHYLGARYRYWAKDAEWMTVLTF